MLIFVSRDVLIVTGLSDLVGWRRKSYIGLTEIAKLIWDIHMFFLSQDDRACVLVGLVT